MRHLLSLALPVCALAACGSSAAASSGPASSGSASGSGSRSAAAQAHCGPASARTLAVGAQARVYAQSGAAYGCVAGSRRRYLLGHLSICVNSDRVGPVVVAGRLAAFSVTRCGVDTGSATVEVRRLSDGAGLYSHAAADAAGPEGFITVTQIVASASGAVAWIARASTIVGHRSITGVFVRRGAGVSRLDSGAAIKTGSLRLSGTSVSWQDGSARRSAQVG